MNDGIELASALRLVGRNVVANRFLAEGQLVMQAATVQLDTRQYLAIREAELQQYCIAHPVDPDGGLLLLSEAALCLTPEVASLTSHATNLGANGWIVEFRAARDIHEGELLSRRDQADHWSML